MNKDILIIIEGGIANVMGTIPEGYDVVIQNFDVDGTENNLKTAKDGCKYRETRQFTIYPKVN